MTFRNEYHIVIRQFPKMSSWAKYMVKHHWSFLYQISHQHLVIISDFQPTGSLANLSVPRADKGTDVKKAML